jgi:hypothetical protein
LRCVLLSIRVLKITTKHSPQATHSVSSSFCYHFTLSQLSSHFAVCEKWRKCWKFLCKTSKEFSWRLLITAMVIIWAWENVFFYHKKKETNSCEKRIIFDLLHLIYEQSSLFIWKSAMMPIDNAKYTNGFFILNITKIYLRVG